MPEYTPQHSIAYPLPNDRIKDTSVAAKLANDIRATAVTADSAITNEGTRAENAAKQAASTALSQAQQQLNTEITTEGQRAENAAKQYAEAEINDLSQNTSERLAPIEQAVSNREDITDPLFTIIDDRGNATWVAARASDGGPTDWSMDHISHRLGVQHYAQDTTYLFAVVDENERFTDLAVRASDGQVPDWVLDRWRHRMQFTSQLDASSGVSSEMVPLLQSIAAGVERHVADTPLQPFQADFTTGPDQDQPAKLIFPERYNDVRPMPLVLSFMGIGSSVGSHWTYTDLREKLEDAGALMGGGTYGGDLYGAPNMLSSAREVYEHALRIAPVSGVILYGNSMGGIGALNALTTGTIPNVLGVYLVDPTFDLRQRYDNGRAHEIQPAYGIAPDGSDYDEKTAGYDPAIRPPADFKGVPIRVYSSDGDSLWDRHTLKLVEHLQHSNDVAVHNTGTDGHNTSDRFNGTDLADFITRCVGGTLGLRA